MKRALVEETMSNVLEGGGEMVEKHCWVVLLKLPDEPPPLFDWQVMTKRNMLNELVQALEGVLLSLLLKLPCRYLLTEREHYTATHTRFSGRIRSSVHAQVMRSLRKLTCYVIRIPPLLQGSQGLRYCLDQRRWRLGSLRPMKTEIRRDKAVRFAQMVQ